MSLLRKASIVTTPTAYENGKILSVKPSVVLGNELVVNGGFNTDSDWTLGTGWTISNGKANCDGISGASPIYQNIGSATIGKTYKIQLDVSNYTSGTLVAAYGGTSAVGITSNGSYIFYVKATSTDANTSYLSYNFTGSIDNVSLKELTDADFQFTRNSSATRVNSQGLIEDMQILSGDLVSNGDFSQIGSEEITNGGFDTDSDWTLGTGWSIANGKLTANNPTSYAQQGGVFASGVSNTYKISLTVSNYVSGYFTILTGGSTAESQQFSANGNYTITFNTNSPSSTTFHFTPFGSFNGSIDNVSVKEVGQDWTLVGDFKVNNQEAFITNASQYSQLTNQIGVNYLLSGKKYKLEADIGELSISGALAYRYNGGAVQRIYTTDIIDGKFTAYFTMPQDGQFWFQTTANYTGLNATITNIKIIEITEDTNLPRIDYTGGEGHWLFEPQSTNLIPYSEDFNSGWTQYGSPTINISSIISPNGTLNGSKITRGSNATPLRYQSLTSTGTQYTFSLYAKKGSVDKIYLDIGDVADVEFTLTDEWQRFQVTQTPTTYTHIDISFGTSVSGDHFFIFGAQLEQQSFATSIIPTEGSIKTRLQDKAFGAGSSDLINSTEGVLYAEISALANGGVGDRYISLGSGSSQNTIQLLFHNTANRVNFRLTKAGSLEVNISDFTFLQTDDLKIACKFKENDFALWINGVERVVDTSGETFSVNTLQEIQFDSGTGASNFFGRCKTVAVFKEALNNDELECLTGEGYDSFNALALANNYTII